MEQKQLGETPKYTRHGSEIIKMYEDGYYAKVRRAELYLVGKKEPINISWKVREKIASLPKEDRNMLIELDDKTLIAYGQITQIKEIVFDEPSIEREAFLRSLPKEPVYSVMPKMTDEEVAQRKKMIADAKAKFKARRVLNG
jgi:hypothetical protein